MTPEGRVKKIGGAAIKRHATWHYMPIKGRFEGSNGQPDQLCIINGKFMGIEYKSTRCKKPTVLQALQLEAIENSGGLALVIDKENVQYFVDYLENGDRTIFDEAHGAFRWRQVKPTEIG